MKKIMKKMSWGFALLTFIGGQMSYAQVSTGPKNNTRTTETTVVRPGHSDNSQRNINTRNNRDNGMVHTDRSTTRVNKENVGTLRGSDINYRRNRDKDIRNTLPPGFYNQKRNGKNYYFHNGHFYTDYNGRYIITRPVVGFTIPTLPGGYSRITMNRTVYYYYYGTFFTLNRGYYQVVNPPIGTIVNSIPPTSERIYFYGQMYYEFNGIIFMKKGRRYQVVGFLDY